MALSSMAFHPLRFPTSQVLLSHSPPTDPQVDAQPAAKPPAAGHPGQPVKATVDRFVGRLLLRSILILVTAATLLDIYEWRYGKLNIFEPRGGTNKPIPLAMEGGDPYLRALMRTISASESNVSRPYSVIYGGEYFRGWSQHPDDCVYIPVGPNTGNCSTAAGRYQFITTTWEEQAKKYHPEQPKVLFWRPYSFDPVSQDVVLHRWLADDYEWGVDLSQLLQAGQIERVLEILSPTWTSLGYGIETNSMSAYLPEIYWEMLDEELTALAPVTPATVLPAATEAPEPEDPSTSSELAEPGAEQVPVQTYAEDFEAGPSSERAKPAASQGEGLREGWVQITEGGQKLLKALFDR